MKRIFLARDFREKTEGAEYDHFPQPSMPRKYDQDVQPMMSDSKMLKMLVDEIPVNDKRFSDLEDRLTKRIDSVAADLNEVKSNLNKVKSDLSEVKSDLKTLNIKSDQNHLCLMTNQDDMERRLQVLENVQR